MTGPARVDQPSPFIFLSHSGADSDAARNLKHRLLASPDARAAGLKVWFDKDDLRPGASWQPQIEQAIANATAFVVYVGSKGVMNWVEAEVRVALSRANTNKDFLFIPALAADSAGSSALPAFAKLYEAVRDPLSKVEELAKLLKAVLKSDWDKAARLIDEPFVGLRSMREEEADRFFGRKDEIAELVERFRKHRVVAIIADSGTGKSSLAEAGFVPAFRGGTLADFSRDDPDDRLWHVVTMRPGANPEEGLRTGITEAAEKLGQTPDARAGLRKRVAIADASETAFALQCDLQARKTATLLIVDQFEELFNATPDALVAPFVRLLLDLADGDKDIRILVTVRADYFNLLSDVKDAAGEVVRGANGRTLFERLSAESGGAILRLKRVSEDGIRDIVCKPLQLAGESSDQTALVKAVQRDISDQPSDLPLLQVALKAAWREHKATNLGLLAAYHSVGGVLGALAREAEKVRTKLSADDQARLESIFVRLVRLGDTGGATRRTASLKEFDAPRQALLRRLGDDAHGRLVVISEASAEIAHEALITQWPWLLRTLRKNDARDVRTLDRLMSKAREWSEAPKNRKRDYLATGAERETFDEVAKQRTDWLSTVDREFVEASNFFHNNAREIEVLDRLKSMSREWSDAPAERQAAYLAAGAERESFDELARQRSDWLSDVDRDFVEESNRAYEIKREKERRAFRVARHNESVARTALANVEAARRPVNAAKLALAAWPRDSGDIATPKLLETLDALGRIVPNLRERRLLKDAGEFAAFSPDGSRVVSASSNWTARVWDAATGNAIAVLSGHKGQVHSVHSATFSRDGSRIVTASSDKTARVWEAATGTAVAVLSGHQATVKSAVFSPDGSRIVTASSDKTARLWESATGKASATLSGHQRQVRSAAFSPDGLRIVTASLDKTARIWDAATGTAVAVLSGHEDQVSFAVFSPDGSRIVTASEDKTARVWVAANGKAIAVLSGHESSVHPAAFSPDGSGIVTASDDKTARLWDAATGRVLGGHEDAVWSAAFSPDGSRVVTASLDKTARLWDAATGKTIAVHSGHEDQVNSAAFSPDGSRIVTASADNSARVWDAASDKAIAVLSGHEDQVNSAAFSPDGSRIVTGSWDKTARVWEAATGKPIAVLSGHEDRVNSAAFSPDGSRIVTAPSDNTARIWEAATGTAIVVLSGHQDAVKSAAFSPDGSRIVTGSNDKTARVWDAATGTAVAVLSGHEYWLTSATFSPDGSRIVTASLDNTACVWDAATDKAVTVLSGHKGWVNSAAFSPDGSRIVTASSDNTARVWDAATGKALAVLGGHENSVNSATFNPDGTRIVTASEDKTARVWDVSAIPKGNILQVACALLRLHEDPVSLEGVTEYPLTFDRPICATDPPPPDPPAEPAAKAAEAK